MNPRVSTLTLGLGIAAALAVGCSSQDPQELAKLAMERAKASARSIDHAAAAQQVDAEAVKQVQQQLTVLKEYMGPINGRLDPVTLNAFEAFQRSEGMTPDGMFTRSALERLAEQAKKQSTS